MSDSPSNSPNFTGHFVDSPKGNPLYASLRGVLDEAYLQAESGKGHERHAGNGLAFEDQPMQTISELVRSSDGLNYQAIKKIQEASRLPLMRAERELLGAINYIAGIILYRRKHEAHEHASEPSLEGLLRDNPSVDDPGELSPLDRIEGMDKLQTMGGMGAYEPVADQSCRFCGYIGKVSATVWPSSNSVHKDAHYRCAACGKDWWVDRVASQDHPF